MNTRLTELIDQAGTILSLSADEVLYEGIEALLEHRLLQLNSQVIALTDKYGVKSVTEMDKRYQDGTLSEANSWEDFQTLDHLEYDRDRVVELLNLLRSTAHTHRTPVAA